MPQQVTNEKLFKEALALNELVLCDFTAAWCGPCKQISPIFDQLSYKYPFIKFIKVDIDQVSSVAYAEQITAMPTFVTYFNGSRINSTVGANPQALEELIQELAQKRVLDLETLRKMSIKDLKSLCSVRNVPKGGCIEKEDLVQRLMESNRP